MGIKRINWLGLAGGVTTLSLVVVALVYASPWWQLAIGEEMGRASTSPLNFNADLFGESIRIPIIQFLNVGSLLSLIACAIAILIYSIVPNKSYSQNLLNFAYKKPLIIVIVFLVVLFIATYVAGTLFHSSIPLMGSAIIKLSFGGVSIAIPITTGFTWTFWLAVVAAGLCIAAKIYHKRIMLVPTAKTSPEPPKPPESKEIGK